MKRSLISALILVILAVVGLLLLTVNWSAGSASAPAASRVLSSDSSPLYSTSSSNSIPTPLPNLGIQMGTAEELSVKPSASLQSVALPRIISLDADSETLVGVGKTGEDTYAVMAIDLGSGEMQILFEEQTYLQEPRISGDHVIWTTLKSLYIYNLNSRQLEQKDFGIVRSARISGDTVVWQSAGDIEGYNLSTGEKFSVANDPNVVESLPLISGEWVVYLTPTSSFSAAHLWAVNIRTQERIYIAELPLEYQDEEYRDSVYVIDKPLVAWASENALNLYNLVSHTAYTVPVESCVYTRMDSSGGSIIENRKPSHLAISENTIIFSCGQQMGYDIELGVFFSLPVHTSEISDSEFDRWTVLDGRVVWELTEGAFGPEEQGHIYTAHIERNP